MRYLIIYLLLSLGSHASAQQYFNIRDPLHGFYSVLTTVHETNNKYYCTGLSWDSSNYIGNGMAYNVSGVEFSVFDQHGNKLLDTVYQKSGKNMDAWSNASHVLPNGNIIIPVDAVDTSDVYLMLVCLDSNGRLVWEKVYQKPVCAITATSNFWRMVDFQPDGYGNWLMLSTVKCDPAGPGNDHHDMLLMKLDSSFNVIWYKQFSEPTGKNLTASKILADANGYVLAGGLTNDNRVRKNFIFQAHLIKTDTAGKVQWTYLSPASRLTNVIQDVIKTQDGGYVYCGQGDGWEEAHPNGTSAHVNWNAWVEKIDVNRNMVWGKKIYNKYEFNTEFIAVKEAPDGRLRLFGKKYEADSIGINNWHGHSRGWFVTLDANGDSLQERVYSIINTCLDKHWIYDVKQTSDGGYIIVGEATDDCPTFTAPTQRAWLIKVDSNGCMSPTDPQCHPTGTDPELQQLTAISLYPNPVSGTLYINNTRKEPLSVTIYDLMGRAVQEQKLRAGINELPMHGIPAGVYLYKLTGGRSIVQQGKLVKE